MNPLRSFHKRPPTPRGVHFGEAESRWAEARFEARLRPAAARAACLLCEQLGLTLRELEPAKYLGADLRIDSGEWTEVVLALREDLGLDKAALESSRPIDTLADFVEYLHERLRLSEGSAADPS